MNKKLSVLTLASFAALVFLFQPVSVNAQFIPLSPFGGQILVMTPCLYPWGGFFIQLGPPNGGAFLYQTGYSFSYLNGPPAHVGQWLLGMSTGGTSCYTGSSNGKWDEQRSGGLIIFHGSSF